MSEAWLHPADSPTPVVLGPPHPCPYLDARDARFAYGVRMPPGPDGYEQLLNAGFRRSGLYVYRTACATCRECRPLRISTDSFSPSRSQRRALRINSDLDVAIGRPVLDDEKIALFSAYLASRHDGQMSADPMELQEGLYRSLLDTVELTARLQGRLVVVGIVDVGRTTLSLVYSAYDPALEKRSLGVAFILWCVAFAEMLSVPHIHLGYWVPGSRTMAYKSRFRPHEILHPDGFWRPGA